MAKEMTWEARVRQKRLESETIPAAWQLPAGILKDALAQPEQGVLRVPTDCGILDEKEVAITEKFDAVSLLEEIRCKRLTSYEVVLSFCKRAAIAHQLVNCLTETFFARALERAKELDDYLEREGKTLGPLHGLPISVKDTFNIKGVPTTIGYVSFIKGPEEFDSTLIKMLEGQGAVLYVKTNIPQTLFAPDSNNNVFGRTLNPHNLTLTAGGSSGGEGALIAMRGSVLGVGSDMAGSIRIPSMCNGTFGFKPTEHRIPYDGQCRPDKPGLPGPIFPVAGPMGRSARDMSLFLQIVIDAEPWKTDFLSPPLPWRRVSVRKTPLRIGFILECPTSPIETPIKQTLTCAAKSLEKAGHTLVDLRSFPPFLAAHDLAYSLMDMDNSQTSLRYIADSGEPMVEATRDLNPTWPDSRRIRSLDEIWEGNAKRSEIMRQWHHIFCHDELDILILPGFGNTAVSHDTMRSCPYMVMWNLVNYPASIIPVERANSDRIDAGTSTCDGSAPCHIQVVAPTYRDEELAMATEMIAQVLKLAYT